MVEVTQDDRDAAASSLGWKSVQFLREIRAGDHDSTDLVQAFARHRIAAENAALEEAAKVAEKWIEPVMATPHENATYRSIATAIRALKGPADDPA